MRRRLGATLLRRDHRRMQGILRAQGLTTSLGFDMGKAWSTNGKETQVYEFPLIQEADSLR